MTLLRKEFKKIVSSLLFLLKNDDNQIVDYIHVAVINGSVIYINGEKGWPPFPYILE